jgi:DnaJ-class molecular chaperone
MEKDQVKDAWREQVKNWHPHTIKDQNVQEDPRVKEEFNREFIKIMKAYDEIKKDRGWN